MCTIKELERSVLSTGTWQETSLNFTLFDNRKEKHSLRTSISIKSECQQESDNSWQRWKNRFCSYFYVLFSLIFLLSCCDLFVKICFRFREKFNSVGAPVNTLINWKGCKLVKLTDLGNQTLSRSVQARWYLSWLSYGLRLLSL